jgi:nucleolin
MQSSDEDEEDDDDSEDDSDDDSDDSDSSGSDEEEDEEVQDEAPAKKRKAEPFDETPAKKARVEEEGKAATLFAGNLTWNVDDDTLYEEFKEFEDLVGARVITDKATGKSRGFGYVDFANPEAAQKAYDAKNGQLLDGRDMRLDFAQKRSNNNNNESPAGRSADRAKKFGDVVSPESDTLFVGNLPFDVDEDGISAFFGEVCNVKSLRLPTDQYVLRSPVCRSVTLY